MYAHAGGVPPHTGEVPLLCLLLGDKNVVSEGENKQLCLLNLHFPKQLLLHLKSEQWSLAFQLMADRDKREWLEGEVVGGGGGPLYEIMCPLHVYSSKCTFNLANTYCL